MIYEFAMHPMSVSDKTVITGKNARGIVENGVLTVENEKTAYRYEKGEWYIKTDNTDGFVPCGEGAVPTLKIENLQALDEEYFESILYKAAKEGEKE